MIELKGNQLVFSFPDVHGRARCSIEFQRTLRIPDDDREYPLPPGMGRFPVRHVDDHADRVPAEWKRHGGVMLPMYQSEAMWLNFVSPSGYPFAVKVAAGKVNAVTGEDWREGLNRHPQDYMVIPDQPWLDGYVVKEGTIRQFVAMPLGDGYSPEEQLRDRKPVGGLQVEAFPMKAEVYERRFGASVKRARMPTMEQAAPSAAGIESEMGLGAGGAMKQEVYEDEYSLEDWDLRNKSRCFVHLCNSMSWRQITGENPPTTPFTAKEYEARGLPWFDHYSEKGVVDASDDLAGVDSVNDIKKKKGETPLDDGVNIEPDNIVNTGEKPSPHKVREGEF